ncbi:hypothetical protein [Rhizobium lusitanum]|uniref:Uncharacterized protein n=1 Tax=Rhizobium lusitanum TaxID=293958 RepID=A0A1C3WDY6_9HYPH|nr:hypothetical protein [Rhizobium lusitanum]SCB37904.1 hypothetical protein GA0061101_11094 [Rhizobium lusitanum]
MRSLFGSCFESGAMGFVSWRLVGMLRLHSQRNAGTLGGLYEPWVNIAIDRFEHEIEARQEA